MGTRVDLTDRIAQAAFNQGYHQARLDVAVALRGLVSADARAKVVQAMHKLSPPRHDAAPADRLIADLADQLGIPRE